MVEGPVSSRRFSRRQIRSTLMIVGGVVATLVIAFGGWQLYSVSRQSAAEEAGQQLDELAGDRAQQIAGVFAKTRDRLRTAARDPELIALLSRADKDEIVAAAAARQGQFDKALKLRLVLPGAYALEDEVVPPLGFASLDMLKRAESSREEIPAEAHLMGGPQEHIVMLQRVANEADQLVGILHLSLDVKVFADAMAVLDSADAYVELQQQTAARALVLGKHGSEALRVGEPVSAPVTDTRWTVALWVSGGSPSAAEAGVGMGLIGIIVVLLLLALAAAWWLRNRQGAAGPGDEEEGSGIVYAGAVRAIMDGAHPGMEKMVPNLPPSTNRVAEQPVSQGEVGDDITMIIKSEHLKAAASGSEMLDLTQAQEPESPAPAKPKAAAPARQPGAPKNAPVAAGAGGVSAEIFRAYDIRGIVGENLNAEIVTKIGQAIGSEAGARGQATVVVGRDGRTSSPELAEALISGLRGAGRDVIDVGVVPTPVLYFAAHFFEVYSGVMLTGSHNGPKYNGLKIVIAGETLSEDGIQAIYKRIQENNYEFGEGSLQSREIIADYIRRVTEDIPVALGGAYKIVVDCGNGVAGAVAPQLLRALGHDVVELYCDIDGNFPNHHPDPSQPENLQALLDKLAEEKADLGLAFDGDGDRLGVVDDSGKIIWPDRQLMLLAKDVLSRNKGMPVIFDVKCSRYLKAIIEASGGKAVMWKTGHSLIKNKMKELNAPLAGEMSGHIFFKERWYGFDDAIYTAARLLEVLMKAKAKPSETFAEMPEGISTPELRIDLPESAHKTFMSELAGKLSFDGAKLIDIDGYRVEFADGWGLIRPSNTTPCLVLRFEADSQESLERIQEAFRQVLQAINPDLQLPF